MIQKQINQTTYSFPHWSKVAKTYSAAVQKRLDEIKATRPFYNWRDGQIDEQHLRETPQKAAGIKKLTKKGIVTIEVQLGSKYKGKSVHEARSLFQEGEFGLGAYEVTSILLANPDVLKSYDDLWIDCPGDEFSGSDARFDRAPYLRWSVGELRFGAPQVGAAGGRFGSASAFVPAAKLGTRTLEPFDFLNLETRVKNLEDTLQKIEDILKDYA